MTIQKNSIPEAYNGPMVSLQNIHKTFNPHSVNELTIFENFNLDILKDQFISVIGSNGSGKTTILNLLCGSLPVDGGKILVKGQNITKMKEFQRAKFIGRVFQDPSKGTCPELTILENMALAEAKDKHFGLTFGVNRKRLDFYKSQLELLKLGLEDKLHIQVGSLSGGQRQRVAIARALVIEPSLLLLDEPLSNLDAKLRLKMRVEIRKLQQKLGITTLFVTHDQEEALTMSDTIVVMNEGQIQQIGTPIDIYNEPENRFVAQFIGESNIIEGIFVKDYLVEFDGKQFECVDKGFDDGQDVDIVLRPEDLDIVEVGKGKIEGVVTSIVFKGVHYEIIVETKDRDYMVHTTDISEVGKKVNLDFWPEDIHVMDKMGSY